jgi:hypothetical protein
MAKHARKLNCEEFQRQLSDLINSGADREDHPHVKACPACRQLVQELEVIAEAARKLFPPNGQRSSGGLASRTAPIQPTCIKSQIEIPILQEVPVGSPSTGKVHQF